MKKRFRIFKIVGLSFEAVNSVQYLNEPQANEALRVLPEGEQYIVLPVQVKDAAITQTFICTAEKSAVVIANTYYKFFRITWTNPENSIDAKVMVRIFGSGTWIDPDSDESGFVGNFDGAAYVFTDGIEVGDDIEVLVQNQCGNGIFSAGVSAHAPATDVLP